MTTMRDDDDLEQLLRSTLRARGDSVSTGPTWRAIDDRERPDRHRPRWLAPMLAAAAAAAVAATAVLIGTVGHSDHGSPATSNTPPPSRSSGPTSSAPSPTSSTSSVPPLVANGRFCRATLPPAWRQAFAGSLDVGGIRASIAGVATDGSIVVDRVGSTRQDVLLVPRHGSPVSLLSTSALRSIAVTVDGNNAVVSFLSDGRVETVSRIVALDLTTHRQTVVLAAPSQHTIVDGAAVMDGLVYWDERARPRARSGSVIGFDLASGQSDVVWHGRFAKSIDAVMAASVSTPVTTAGGLAIGEDHQAEARLIVARRLPRVVAENTDEYARARLLRTDGQTYAWGNSNGSRLYWWRPGMRGPRSARAPRGVTLVAEDGATFSVSGNYVVDFYGTATVLDLSTLGAARVPQRADASWSWFTGPTTIAGEYSTGSLRLVRIDPATLPALHC